MRNSLRTQLIILFVLLAAVPLILTGFLLTQQALRTQRTQALLVEGEVARRIASEVEAEIGARITELNNLIEIRGIQGMAQEEQFNVLSSLLSFSANYEDIALVGREGIDVLHLSRSQLNVNLLDRSATAEFTEPQQTGRVYFSPVRFNQETNEPVIVLSLPLYDIQSGAFAGVLLANYRFRAVWDLMQQADLPAQSIAYLIDNNNRVVAHQNPSVVLRGTTVEIPAENGFVIGLNGDEVAMARASIQLGAQTFSVVAEQKTAAALALANTSATISILATGLATILASALAFFAAQRLTSPVQQLVAAAETIAAGTYTQRVAVSRQDELGTLARVFNNMAATLQESISNLEQRVQERTRDLFLATDVSRNISNIRNLPDLLSQAVDLIQERFDLYYVQIYLSDEAGENLVLRAGTGEAGKALLARQHHLPISARSINGKAALTREPVMVADTRQDPLFRPNPFLPLTLSELAIPLLVGEQVVGVLNLQGAQAQSFSEDNLPALTTLAGQLAIAIDNASLFSERQQAEEEMTKFKLGINSSASAIFLTDVQGVIQYVNPGFEQLYGWSAMEAIGNTPRILKSGFTSQDEYETMWQAMLNGEFITGEIVNRTKDGRFVTVDRTNNPIINAAGNLIGFLSINTDVTRRKEAEAQLERSVAELNCLNEIGRKAEEQPPVAEFLVWVTQRIPAAMSYPDQCLAAVSLGEQIYGDREAMSLPRHIVEGLRIGGELLGRLTIAYQDAALAFVDEDSAFIGGIGRRVSSYIESQRLLAQVQKRAAEMETVAQVGTAVTGNLDTTQLLQEVVNLTKARFGLYHAHVYLLNEARDTLVLAAGAGAAGQTMVAEGRRIPLGQEQSLVARAARLRQGVIVNDVQAEPGFLPHPLLPDTCAELAVPLIVGDVVLGVLDVQSDQVDYFSQEEIHTYTTLATQVAAALQNAQQFEQTQLALADLRILQQAFVREGWQAFLADEAREVQGYVAAGEEIKPIVRNGRAQSATAVTLQELAPEKTTLLTPLRLGDAKIGSLGVRLPPNGKLTDQQRLLLNALTAEVSQALERARLAEQTQLALNETELRTQELAILNEMGRAFTADFTMDAILGNIYAYSRQLINAEDMYVALYNTRLDEVDIRIFGEGEDRTSSALVRRGGNGITEYVIRSREPLLISGNLVAKAQELGIDLAGREAQSWLGVPMVVGDEIIGMIAVQDFANTNKFDMHMVDLLTTVANQAAIAIQNTRLFAQTQSRARQEQILREVSTRVNAVVDPESILRTAAREVGRALGLETFVILAEPDEQNGQAPPDIVRTNGS